MRLSFDGTPHLEDCAATYGCDCSARMARQWAAAYGHEGQAPVTDDATPEPVLEVPTARVVNRSNRELMLELSQHADAGQGGDL